MDPAVLLFLILCTWGVARSWGHLMNAYRTDRDAKISQAQQDAAPKGLSPTQKRRIAAQHTAGWWTREVLGGFPVARTGLHAGWHTHRLNALENRNARDHARRLHKDLRQRMKAAGQPPGQYVETGGAEPLPQRHPSGAAPPEDAKVLPWPRHLAPVPDPEPDPPHPNGNGSRPAPQPQGEPQVPTGTTTASEVTYNQLIADGRKTIVACEVREAELMVTQWAKYADALTGTLRDGSTLGNLADMADSVDAELKECRRTKEAAEHMISQLQREHGGMADAHRSAPVRGAQPEFYED